MGSTFALNVLQKMDHTFKITIFFLVILYGPADSERRYSFIDIGALVSKFMVLHFLVLLYITSWKTWNLSCLSQQVLREVEQKCLSPSLGIMHIL